MVHLKTLFERAKEANLKLKLGKCEFFTRRLEFLAHIVSAKGIEPSPRLTEAIKVFEIDAQLTVKQKKKKLLSWVCLGSFMRKFIKNFADLTNPLMELTNEGTPWVWGPACQVVLDTLEEKLTFHPVLAHPQFDKKFIIATDASDTGMGAVLMQERPDPRKEIPWES
jgi:hypothetical protein